MPEVTIKYQLLSNICQCCQQINPNKEPQEKEFTFTKHGSLIWLDQDGWKLYENDLEDIVREHCYETIQFFSLLNQEITVNDEELKKLEKFIYEEVIKDGEQSTR